MGYEVYHAGTMLFLALPLELREQILEFVVATQAADGHLYIDPKIQHRFQAAPSALQPDIALVNKQCRAESLPIFYKSNIFVLSILNESSVRLCQHWIEANKHHLRLIRHIWLKVYPSYDGRPLAYDEFRWHAHGPYWLKLHIRAKTFNTVTKKETLSEIPYLLGITELAATLDNQWSTHRDGWLLTTVDMVLDALAKRLDGQALQLSVDCV